MKSKKETNKESKKEGKGFTNFGSIGFAVNNMLGTYRALAAPVEVELYQLMAYGEWASSQAYGVGIRKGVEFTI